VFALFFYETTLEIGVSICLNLSNTTNDIYAKWGISLTYSFIAMYGVFFIAMTWIFYKTENMTKYSNNFESLYENINYLDNPYARLTPFAFILKRLLFVIVVFYVEFECV
jgi:hypothetical protein